MTEWYWLPQTYDGGVFQPMETFLNILKSKNYQKRTVAIMENGPGHQWQQEQ